MKSYFILLLLLPAFIHAAPVVTSVTPLNGSVAGGNTVQIKGSGFRDVTEVDFGTIATDFVVRSDTLITAVAPSTFLAGGIDVTVTSASGNTSPTSSTDQYTYIDGTWYAFVGQFSPPAVLPIDLTTLAFETLMPTTDGLPFNTAITPNGQFLLVGPRSPLLPVDDLSTFKLSPPVPVTTTSPSLDVAIPPGGTTAYILFGGSGPSHGIQLYDYKSQTFGTFIPISDTSVLYMAVTPDGTKAYVSATSGNVYPVDLILNTVGTPIPSVPFGPIRITPDGTRAFIASPAGSASYIDIATNIANTIPVFFTGGLAINPDGRTVYFIRGFIMFAFDTTTLALEATLLLPGSISAIAVTPDGKTAYLIDSPFDNFLYPVDLTEFSIKQPIIIPSNGPSIVISPDQAPMALFTVTPNLPGLPTTIDASASVSPVGTISNYAWDFGDGNTLETSDPVTSHTYLLPGNYTVTLTVTNSAGTSTTVTFTGQTVSNNGGPSAQKSETIQIFTTLPPPQNVKGFQVENKFLLQDEIQNVITWSTPSGGQKPVAYNIYRDAALTDLIATVPAGGPLEFIQHNAHERTYTYYIVSVDAYGNLSTPITVVIKAESGSRK